MIIEKKHEGTTIYAVPTGNNARNSNGGGIAVFEVVKVRQKYATMIKKGYGREESYCVNTGVTQSAVNSGFALNSGWIFYESLEAIEFEKTQLAKLNRLKKHIERLKTGDISPEKLEAICLIVFDA